ncbi:MAG: hypothetical protein AUJ85_10810 [Elusimicrobia bacterium CG1_02_37_114]|nr:MAG: hypothetical protein AUJ85_10810 [Elusimicrobia bacterium CG1_02_37_114]
MEERISLTEMNANEFGKVVELIGGHGMVKSLENMGIRIGTEIRKVSQQLMGGPVIVSQGNTRVAIGYGMAKRIIIEVKK